MSTFITRTLRSYMARLAGQQFAGQRDLYATFGYSQSISPEDYRNAYARGDIAGRIIDGYPEATWREPPSVRKRNDKEGGEFELAVNRLADKVDLWANLQRLDVLTGLGHYGVLFLGLDGAEDPARHTGSKYGRLLYLTPHGETSAQITNWDSDPRSPRYSQPLAYRLDTGTSWTGVGGTKRSIAAHWSRCIHVAERTLEDRSIGQPRLERIFNRLQDVEKLLGGSAEVWWQNASMLRAWVADPEAQWSDDDKAEMEKQLEELQHQLRRDVRLRGVTPHNLAADAQSNNAAAIIDKQLDFIAGATGYPKRILMGSERGELASEQDENNWAARVAERRTNFATPRMVRPFIDRMIRLGLLDNPGQYDVIWPESDTLGESARAAISLTKAQAVAAYVGTPGTDVVIPPQEFRRWLGEDEQSEFDTPEPDDDPPPGGEEGDPLDLDPEAVTAFNRRLVLIDNADPRPLYVRRDVLNWRQIAKWAKAQGFATTVGEAMHVTIAYSKQPVDWMSISPDWAQKPGDLSGELSIPEGGPRMVQALGDKGAVVLLFGSNDLTWRHEAIRSAGASWDHAEYQPHVTLTYKPGDVDPSKVEPYTGVIELGPELFEEPTEDWSEGLVENVREIP